MSTGTNNTEDDWEKAELSLEAMKLNESKTVLKNSTAPRFNAPSLSTSEINTSGKFTPGSNSSTGSTPVELNTPNSNTEMVDSALLSALSNPRERMVVFQIENTILNFVKSSQDRTLDFPPQYNSFRRLVAYRIGQRFGLTHAQSEFANENGERGITLFKTPGYRIPTVLLIDLNVPVQQDGDVNDNISSNYSENGTPVAVPVPIKAATAAPPPAKKVQVMKRATARTDTDSQKGVNKKEQQSAEDKERAYSEARARIFGEEPPSPTTTSVASTNVDEEVEKGSKTVTTASGASSRQPTPPVNASNRSSNTSSPQPGVNNDGIATVKRVTSDTQLSNFGNNNTSTPNNNSGNSSRGKESPGGETNSISGGKKVVSVNNWKGTKSQYRDSEAERSDPDFSRSRVNSNRNNPNNNNNNNSYAQQQYQNYQQPPPPQQQMYVQQGYDPMMDQQNYMYANAPQYPPNNRNMQPAMYASPPPTGPQGMRLAPTLGNDYYQQPPPQGQWIPAPYNMAQQYYPADPYMMQQQQLQPPPIPQESFYDYSHLSHKNQQRGGGSNKKGGGQQVFNASEFPPLG